MNEPCPECEKGTITEILGYRYPPPGGVVFEGRYVPATGTSVIEVESTRPCCRCGGTGVRRVRAEE